MRKFIYIITLFCSLTMVVQAQQGVVLRTIDGKPCDVGELVKEGHVTVISFFATWCKPCLRELTSINDDYDEWQDAGVSFVAVSIDTAQDSEKVCPLVQGNAWDFTVLLDPEGELKRQLQVQTVPHTVVFDKHGKIVETHTGYTDGDEKRLFSMAKGMVD